jgi:hypothetical protein
MKVFIDGKQVKCLNDVKVVHEDELLDVLPSGENVYGSLEITLNSEGMIADTYYGRKIHGTMWKDLEDIIEETH